MTDLEDRLFHIMCISTFMARKNMTPDEFRAIENKDAISDAIQEKYANDDLFASIVDTTTGMLLKSLDDFALKNMACGGVN